MIKLKAVYREAQESGASVEEIAIQRFGNLRYFDDAREEEIELDRRETYGKDYVGKVKPSGEQFNIAAASFVSRPQSDVVILGTMENRMLAGGRKGEVKAVDNKRGRERGLVEENEDMSIEDMVREERRTRGQVGGEGQRFAERIAKDGKFDASLRADSVTQQLISV
jgi:hypothetical protein